MIHIRHILTCGTAILLSLGMAYGQSADGSRSGKGLDRARLDSLFDAVEVQVPASGSIAILSGRDTYARAWGNRCRDSAGMDRVPNDTLTRFRIGSISKTFTAAMIFKLIEQGKLSLDAPLSTWYPGIRNAERVTVGMMLHQRSGLHNYLEDVDFYSTRSQPRTQAEMVARFEGFRPDFEPGMRYGYSNTNYLLLGYIVERVSGLTYGGALQRYVAKPLGLKNTSFETGKAFSEVTKRGNYALSYRLRTGDSAWVAEAETAPEVLAGAGGIVSTPEDLLAFSRGLFGGSLLADSSVRKMSELEDEYGYGLRRMQFFSSRGLGHTGGIDGYRAILAYYPERDMTVAYCDNLATDRFADLMLAAHLVAFGDSAQRLPDFRVVAVPDSVVDGYTGLYACPELSLKLLVTRDRTQLYAQGTNQPGFMLTPLSRTRFVFRQAGLLIDFEPERAGLVMVQNGRRFVMTRE